MKDKGRGILGNIENVTSDDIRQAMEAAIYDALRDHKRAGNPIAVWDWENECVKIIPPEEIVIPEDDSPNMDPLPAEKHTTVRT